MTKKEDRLSSEEVLGNNQNLIFISVDETQSYGSSLKDDPKVGTFNKFWINLAIYLGRIQKESRIYQSS